MYGDSVAVNLWDTSSRDLVNLFAPVLGAYSPRTISGYTADLAAFIKWCRRKHHNWLPASPKALAEFVDEQSGNHRLSTIKRRLCAVAFAHRLRDLPSPTETNAVHLAVRRACRSKPNRPKQVRGLTNEIRIKIVNACPATLAGIRDAALISGTDSYHRESRHTNAVS